MLNKEYYLPIGCGNQVTSKVVEDNQKNQKQETIKVGVIAPLTGHLGTHGQYMQQGFTIGLDEIHANNGINGKKIEIVYEDTTCEPQPTITALHKLNDYDNVVATLGPFCGSSVRVAEQFAKQFEKIIITPSTNFGFSKYFFSTEHPLKDESEFLARYVYDSRIRKIAVLHYDNDWGTYRKDNFKNKFEQLGGEVVLTDKFESTTRDYRTMITKAMERDAEAIHVIYSQPGLIVNQIREMGFKRKIFGQRGIENPVFMNVAGENAEGITYVYPGGNDSEVKQIFDREMKERFNVTPAFVSRGSYDAIVLLGQALRNCDNEDENKRFNPECMSNYLSNIKEFEGASGFNKYDGGIWNLKRNFYMKTIKDDEFVRMKE